MPDDSIPNRVLATWEAQRRQANRGEAPRPGEMSPYMGGVLYTLYAAHHRGTEPPHLHKKSLESLERRGLVQGGAITPRGISHIDGAFWGIRLKGARLMQWLDQCSDAFDKGAPDA